MTCAVCVCVCVQERRGRAGHVRTVLRSVTKDAVVASQRRATLTSDWSAVLSQLVRDAVLEMHELHDFAKQCYTDETTQTQAATTAKDSDSFRET